MFDILEDTLDFIEGRKTDYSDVGSLINLAANFFIVIAFGISLVMFAYAVIQFITSTGDPKKLEKPKNALTWSFIGMVGSLAVWGIKALVISLLDLETSIFFE